MLKNDRGKIISIMKTLLLHVPKFNNFYKPFGDFIWLNYMPMGLLAIADWLHRHGLDTEVVHLGVEWVNRRHFHVKTIIEDQPDIKAVGISLHWHHQSFDVIETARAIKHARPDIFIFIGGDTASFFHDEIIRDFPKIDAVIRGHGELPALALIKALEKNDDLASVPNLTWRKGRQIIENPLAFVADADVIDQLNYTNFSLLRHSSVYIQNVGLPFFYAKNFTDRQNRKMFSIGSPMMPVPIGRGCPFNCSWCSGSQISQHRLISGLKGFIYRSHDRIIESILEGSAAGYGIMQSAMDPEPVTQEYFIDLWRLIRREGIKTDWIFECNGLPADDFLDEFKQTFPGGNSVIVLSPECGNEDLRLRHKGPGFSNRALMAKLDTLKQYGITTELFFTYGLPGENVELLAETIQLQRRIAAQFPNVRAIRTLSVEMEPGAPWQLEPERFGIVTDRRCFRDFYNAHADAETGPFTNLGYYIPDYFDEPLDADHPSMDFAARLQSIKCKHFCFIHPNPKKCGKKPWQGRLFCGVAAGLMRLKPRNLSKPY
jgi:radical SAM superfamily enzyme YgiQ (UPF0313 family)